ncbi:hypothetical protein, partial [Prevotella sp. CAG:255]|uniref:hypothetical protein n=1 Tax=Prevotella sp. CAG:255 TaxID=1262923 RepID=UPI002584455B
VLFANIHIIDEQRKSQVNIFLFYHHGLHRKPKANVNNNIIIHSCGVCLQQTKEKEMQLFYKDFRVILIYVPY